MTPQPPKEVKIDARRFKVSPEGQRFGKLVILNRSHVGNDKRWYFLCQCDCGTQKTIPYHSIQQGGTKSCGCLRETFKLLPPILSNTKTLYKLLRTGARARGLSFNLDRELVAKLSFSNCFYCDAPPSNILQYRKRLPLSYTGIDRVNNSIGYEPNNVVPCCKQCNLAKRNLGYGDFLTWIDKAHYHMFGDAHASGG